MPNHKLLHCSGSLSYPGCLAGTGPHNSLARAKDQRTWQNQVMLLNKNDDSAIVVRVPAPAPSPKDSLELFLQGTRGFAILSSSQVRRLWLVHPRYGLWGTSDGHTHPLSSSSATSEEAAEQTPTEGVQLLDLFKVFLTSRCSSKTPRRLLGSLLPRSSSRTAFSSASFRACS